MTFTERRLAIYVSYAGLSGQDSASSAMKLVSISRICMVYHESGPTKSANFVDLVISDGKTGLPKPDAHYPRIVEQVSLVLLKV